MATGVIYLDVDDEITSAATRIRSADGRRVAVVLPYGSRVATSRINFRLLARDAMTHKKRLSVIAGDAATRALAASAGLPVFASVGEYERSEEAPAAPRGAGEPVGLAASATVVTVPDVGADPGPERDLAAPAREHGPSLTTATARTVPVRKPAVPASLEGPGAHGPERPRSERVQRPARGPIGATPVLIGVAVLALAVVVGAVAAFLLLPSATVAISPRQETIGPVPLQVIASTTATEPDADAGIVPAETVPIEVQAANTFPAMGKRVEEAAAKGVVRFRNFDPTTKNSIAKGAVVSTASGARFTTDRAISVPAAKLVFGEDTTVVPSSVDVTVTAVAAGPEGNVEANTITTVPRGEEPLFLKVNNPDPTAGGTRTEFIRVKQDDVDAAVLALTDQLSAAFADRLEDPELSGDGATVFPDTATRGEPVFGQDLEALVGQEVETFDLSATLSGSVTAVDAARVQLIAEARLASSVDEGYSIVDGSSVIMVDPAVVSGGAISFPVVVTARQVRDLDPAAIEAEILGRPLADARAILESYGDVDLIVWPDWVGTIPTIDSRVEVTIDVPVTVEAPSASAGAP